MPDKKIFPHSKIQYTLYHYTRPENVEKILKDGFKSAAKSAGSTYTNNFDGVFFTQSEQCYWNNDAMVRIAVKIDMRNPLDISDFPADESKYTPAQRALAEKIHGYLHQAEVNHDKIMGDKFSQSVMAIEATKVFQAAGYDGLIYNSSDGHVEHVVFDPKNIKIIDTPRHNFERAQTKVTQQAILNNHMQNQSSLE